MAELSFSDVGKSFGSATVLRDIDATVAKGEFVALLGPSDRALAASTVRTNPSTRAATRRM